MINKKVRVGIVAGALAATLAVGGSLAYFTDADTAVNEFTFGKVSLKLLEPNYEADNATEIVPNQEIAKDPRIKNNGINNEFVFLEVTVPTAVVKTSSQDGTVAASASKQQLFEYTVNNGWTQVGAVKSDSNGNTYVYAYTGSDSGSLQTLAAGSTTPALFDGVKLINVVEDQGLEESALDITINAYGIQDAYLNNGDTTIDGVNSPGKDTPSDVWDVVKKASPTS